MAKPVLFVNTPHGSFTRRTDNTYSHVVVRSCSHALRAFEHSELVHTGSQVEKCWIKDRGYVVTWHRSEALARHAAGKPYAYGDSVVLGIYPVGV